MPLSFFEQILRCISSLLTTRICCNYYFILGSSLTLLAVREVSPLNFELFEAELTIYPDRVKQTSPFRVSRKALDLIAINP